MTSATYYEIIDLNMVGKLEGNLPYIYDPKQGWIVDKEFLLMDRLVGYDSSEPNGSPYKFGALDMLDRVRKISREEAEKRISIKF